MKKYTREELLELWREFVEWTRPRASETGETVYPCDMSNIPVAFVEFVQDHDTKGGGE